MRKTLCCLVLAVLCLSMGTVEPPRAEAATANFTCSLLAPNKWCRHGVWHNYYASGAVYNAGGGLNVCSRVVRRVAGGVYASICGPNAVGMSFARCNCGGLWADVKHTGGVNRNIHGWGSY